MWRAEIGHSHVFPRQITKKSMPVANENVGAAFVLVTGAGAATAVGTSVVFFPTLVKLTSNRVLASALGISAGVMFYVSFLEIFNKSILSFEEGGETPERVYIFSTLWFFGVWL